MPEKRLIDSEIPEQFPFDEQMRDLGVKVERPNQKEAESLTAWLKPWNLTDRRGKGFLRVRATYIAVSEDIYENLKSQVTKTGDQVKLAFKVVRFEGQCCLVFKYDPGGYAVHIHKASFKLTMPPKLRAILEDKGISQGHYNVRPVKGGGFLAVKEGE